MDFLSLLVPRRPSSGAAHGEDTKAAGFRFRRSGSGDPVGGKMPMRRRDPRPGSCRVAPMRHERAALPMGAKAR
jgi:hypothetical protein